MRQHQLLILTRQAKALEDMHPRQSKVVSALADQQRKQVPAWFAEAERRREDVKEKGVLALLGELGSL